MKMQLKPVYLQFLSTQAIPSVKGTLPEDAQPAEALDPVTFEPTGAMVDPAMQMKLALETVANGGVIVLPFGATADLLQTQINTGVAFVTAFDLIDKHIAKGISKQTLATEEAKHQARAASQVQQDILDMPTERLTQALCDCWREDYVRPLVMYNYGPEASRKLCPLVQVQEVNQQDFNAASGGFSSLAQAGILDTANYDQMVWAMGVLGGPPPDQDEFVARQEAAQAAMVQQPTTPEQVPPVTKGGQPPAQGQPKPPVPPKAPAPGTQVGEGEARPGESGVKGA